jgi:hypothetical protein
MNVEEAKGVCKDRSKWKKVISAYDNRERVWRYVCMWFSALSYKIFNLLVFSADLLQRFFA